MAKRSEYDYYWNNEPLPEREHILAGMFGAFIYAWVGGALWFVLYQLGFLAAASGVVAAIFAYRGYVKFAKRESIKGVIFSSIIAFLVLIGTWYLCVAKDIYSWYQIWYSNGEVEYMPNFGGCLRVVPDFLENPSFGDVYYEDLLKGLGFAVLGTFGTIISKIKELRAK